MATIEEAAQAAGLTDMDLLKLAKPGLTPDAAVADLRQRFAGAFPATPTQYRDMDDAQRVVFLRRTGLPVPSRQQRQAERAREVRR